jgi:hypothetical protein
MRNLLLVLALVTITALPLNEVFAKGSSGGRSGGSRSSVSKPSTPKPAVAKPTVSKPVEAPKPKPPSAKPSKNTPTKVADKDVKSANGKKMSRNGKVVGEGYQPKFKGGYTAPAGSTVYYPERSFIDYLPWIFLFSQSMDSHREVVVETPDGQQQTQQEEGLDSMYVINWIVSILLVFGLIALVIYLMNRKRYAAL